MPPLPSPSSNLQNQGKTEGLLDLPMTEPLEMKSMNFWEAIDDSCVMLDEIHFMDKSPLSPYVPPGLILCLVCAIDVQPS